MALGVVLSKGGNHVGYRRRRADTTIEGAEAMGFVRASHRSLGLGEKVERLRGRVATGDRGPQPDEEAVPTRRVRHVAKRRDRPLSHGLGSPKVTQFPERIGGARPFVAACNIIAINPGSIGSLPRARLDAWRVAAPGVSRSHAPA